MLLALTLSKAKSLVFGVGFATRKPGADHVVRCLVRTTPKPSTQQRRSGRPGRKSEMERDRERERASFPETSEVLRVTSSTRLLCYLNGIRALFTKGGRESDIVTKAAPRDHSSRRAGDSAHSYRYGLASLRACKPAA